MGVKRPQPGDGPAFSVHPIALGRWVLMLRGARLLCYHAAVSMSRTTLPAADNAGPGRNDPCPCGSGRKFKQCCLLTPRTRPVAAATPAASLDPLKLKAGGALTRAGRIAAAFSPLQQGLRLGPAVTPAAPAPRAEVSQAGEESAQAYLDLARGYGKAGRLDDAVQAWRQAARLTPANHIAWQELGGALMQLGRLPDAIGAFRRAILAKPDFASAHHMLGLALEAQGNGTMAVAALRRAVALSPKLADAHARIGTLSLGLSRREEAISSLRRAAAVAPHSDIGPPVAGQGADDGGTPAEAERCCAACWHARGTISMPTRCSATYCPFDGEFEAAGREYQRAIDSGKQPTSAYHSLVSSRRLTEADRPLIEDMQRRLRTGRWPDSR